MASKGQFARTTKRNGLAAEVVPFCHPAVLPTRPEYKLGSDIVACTCLDCGLPSTASFTDADIIPLRRRVTFY